MPERRLQSRHFSGGFHSSCVAFAEPLYEFFSDGLGDGSRNSARSHADQLVLAGKSHCAPGDASLRNSPWLVILFIAMYMMPEDFGLPGGIVIPFPGWMKATVAFALPVMGNISEIVRGAVRSIPSGQWESAESLGFTRVQTLWNIILPQSFRRSIPPWMNWYALLTLSTPMASIFSVRESVANAQAAMEASGGRPEFLFPFYLFLLCLFFAYIYPIALLTRKLEKRYAA